MSDDQNSENESPESTEPIILLAMKSQRITEALWASQVAPFVEQSRALLERLQPVVAVKREFQKAVAPALAAWQEWFRLTSPLTQVLEKWRQEMEPMPRNVFINPDVLHEAHVEALRARKPLGQWLEEAIKEKIEREQKK